MTSFTRKVLKNTRPSLERISRKKDLPFKLRVTMDHQTLIYVLNYQYFVIISKQEC